MIHFLIHNKDLATEPKLLDMIEKSLGQNFILFSSQLATKHPNSGKLVPWHQDGERCRTVWIPLDDVNEQNGALRVIPGLHKVSFTTSLLHLNRMIS